MPTSSKMLIDLETKFWQSIVDQDPDTAVAMLNEPALMVSSHGAMKFDHAGYKKMATQDSMVLKSFELSDVEVVFPNETTAILTYGVKQNVGPPGDAKGATKEMADSSTWILTDDGWRCVMHTETPIDKNAKRH